MSMNLVPCLLRKGVQERTSLIPRKFAVEGSFVKLLNKHQRWEDGWLVISA